MAVTIGNLIITKEDNSTPSTECNPSLLYSYTNSGTVMPMSGINLVFNPRLRESICIKEDFEMDEKGKTGNNKTRAIILGVIGIILFILGILIVSIHGAPLRGSGVGTIAIIAGIILLVFAALRFRSKRAK